MMNLSEKILLLFCCFALPVVLQACSQKSEQEVRAEAVKILIYNDGRVLVNGESVAPGEYEDAIERELQSDSEIWYWREDPYGVPKGNGKAVTAAMVELGLFRVWKLYETKDFTGDYVETWGGNPNDN